MILNNGRILNIYLFTMMFMKYVSAFDSSFDLYIFAQSWQGAFCRSHAPLYPGCTNPRPFWKTHFTIHGLWPENEVGNPPEECSTNPLNITYLDTISYDLHTHWPNVKVDNKSESYPSFWQHEWNKHGTCSGLDTKGYFNMALKLEGNLSTPLMISENVGNTISSHALRALYPLDSIVLKCHSTTLVQLFTCWSINGKHQALTLRNCPKHVLKEDTCHHDMVDIVSFPQKEDDFMMQ